MAKQYQNPEAYEAKLEKVMKRLNVDSYNFDWSRFSCWVEFWVNGQYYRFEHSVENARKHGQDIKYGSDVFAQVVLTLEDIARMTERGIYELQTWIAGLKALPPSPALPDWALVMQFEALPQTAEDVEQRYKRLAKVCHPDAGGSDEAFKRLAEAREAALSYVSEAGE